MSTFFGDSRLPSRFWAKVRVNDTTGCWEWSAAQDADGYGMYWDGGRPHRAHRVLFSTLVHEVAPARQVDHLCGVTSCVRPDHLEDVTQRENLRRSRAVSSVNAARTHCHLGHEFTDENTYRYANGWRRCRTCARLAARVRRARPSEMGVAA